MAYTAEQLSRLPKWAQDEIGILERLVSKYQRQLGEYLGEADTNTFIQDGLDEKPIQNNACVVFKTGTLNRNRVRIRIERDGSVNINTHSDIGQTMIIRPSASNSFHIDFID